MRKTISGAALWLCAAAGCSRPATPENFAGEYEAALCAWASGCSAFSSPGQCRDALVWDTTGRFQYLLAALEADRVGFDAEAAEECFAQIAEQQCAEDRLNAVLFAPGPSAAPAACQGVFVGKVRNYDPCLNSEECAGDNAVCGFDPTCTEACCAGSCRDLGSPPEIGDMCSGTCGDDGFCARDPNTGAFTVCTERRGVEQSCGDDSNSCAQGLYCDFNAEIVCKKLLGNGDSCANGGRCGDGFECYDPGDGERRCQVPPGEGQLCSTNNYPACVRVDNFCNPASGKCEKKPGPGEACPDYECIPYAECSYNGGSPRCVVQGGLDAGCGEANDYVSCIGHLQCGEGERCVEPEREEECPVPK